MFQFAGTYISSSVLDCKNFANLTHLSYFIKRFYIKCRYVTKSSQKVLFRYSLANSNIQPYSNPILHKRALHLGTQTKINFVKPLLCVYKSTSVTRKKSTNVYKSCTKMISLAKLKILTPLQKLPKNVQDLDKLIVAKGFKKLPKVL